MEILYCIYYWDKPINSSCQLGLPRIVEFKIKIRFVEIQLLCFLQYSFFIHMQIFIFRQFLIICISKQMIIIKTHGPSRAFEPQKLRVFKYYHEGYINHYIGFLTLILIVCFLVCNIFFKNVEYKEKSIKGLTYCFNL